MGVVRFGAFILDRPARALLRDGSPIELRSQSFEVLDHLVRNAGRVVSKDELLAAVWPRKPANEDSLVQCIVDIRKALGDSGHRIVRTVPRKGYLLATEVAELSPAEAISVQGRAAPSASPALQAAATDSTPSAARPAPAAGDHWHGRAVAAVLLAVVLASAGWLLWSWAGRPAALTMMAEPSIAILPVPLLGDDSDGALASLAGEIATGIWRAPRGFKPDIRPGTTPVDAGSDARRDSEAVGRLPGARYVVRASARREGDVMHVNVELIEAPTGRRVWLDAFQYRPGEAGAQFRAAAHIGRTLAAEILRAEAHRPLPARIEAGHLVILGRSLMNDERSAKTNGEAIALFERAIALDGESVQALTQFARATADHVLNGWAAAGERRSRLAKAEAAINRAIRLEPRSAGALLTRGGVLRAREDYAEAVAAYQEALRLNPNFANAHAELGRAMIDVGEPDKTAAHVRKALELSPDDFARYIWCYWAGLAALYMDDPGEALTWLRRAHEANRQYDNALRLMAVAYAFAGDEAEARKKMDEFRQLRPGATLADWDRPGWAPPSAVARQWARIRETMQRLGLPEGKALAAVRR